MKKDASPVMVVIHTNIQNYCRFSVMTSTVCQNDIIARMWMQVLMECSAVLPMYMNLRLNGLSSS